MPKDVLAAMMRRKAADMTMPGIAPVEILRPGCGVIVPVAVAYPDIPLTGAVATICAGDDMALTLSSVQTL